MILIKSDLIHPLKRDPKRQRVQQTAPRPSRGHTLQKIFATRQTAKTLSLTAPPVVKWTPFTGLIFTQTTLLFAPQQFMRGQSHLRLAEKSRSPWSPEHRNTLEASETGSLHTTGIVHGIEVSQSLPGNQIPGRAAPRLVGIPPPQTIAIRLAIGWYLSVRPMGMLRAFGVPVDIQATLLSALRACTQGRSRSRSVGQYRSSLGRAPPHSKELPEMGSLRRIGGLGHQALRSLVNDHSPWAAYGRGSTCMPAVRPGQHAVYNPLDTVQWELYILPHPVFATLGTDSASLGSVRAAAGPPVPFAALRDCIRSPDPRPGTTAD
jgi:hypothetical protein